MYTSKMVLLEAASEIPSFLKAYMSVFKQYLSSSACVISSAQGNKAMWISDKI